MALGGRMNLYQAVDSPAFIMRVLLSLIPLLLIAWSANNTEALPVQSKQPNTNEVSLYHYIHYPLLSQTAFLYTAACDQASDSGRF